jgi:hypothetical protein
MGERTEIVVIKDSLLLNFKIKTHGTLYELVSSKAQRARETYRYQDES